MHIGPDETDTLAHIPAALLFPAPGLPDGHLLLGYDQRGHCPMLVEGRCTIYQHRPRTCRTYDCRVFAAAGIDVDDVDKAQVAQRVRRWRFSYEDESGLVRHAAVRAAAAFLAEHLDELPGEPVALSATRRAVLAVEAHGAFLDAGADDAQVPRVREPKPDAVRAELARWAGRQ